MRCFAAVADRLFNLLMWASIVLMTMMIADAKNGDLPDLLQQLLVQEFHRALTS